MAEQQWSAGNAAGCTQPVLLLTVGLTFHFSVTLYHLVIMRSATGYQVIGYSACGVWNQLQASRCSCLTVPSCCADLGQDNLIGAKSIIGTLAVQVGSLPVASLSQQELRPLTYQLSGFADVACPVQW